MSLSQGWTEKYSYESNKVIKKVLSSETSWMQIQATKHPLLLGHFLLYGGKIMSGVIYKTHQKVPLFSLLILQTIDINNKVRRWDTGIIQMY